MNYTTCAYLRVSTEKQTDGNGLAQQMASIMDYTKARGITVDHWATEAETGTKEDRPVIQELIELGRKGLLKTLLVDRVDRIGREALVSETIFAKLKDAGVEVFVIELNRGFTAHSSLQDVFMRQTFGNLAQLQRGEWLNRMQQCRREAARNKGTFKGGAVPVGFCCLRSGELAPDPRTAPAVVLCFKLRSRGLTLRAICAELAARGHLTSKQTPYQPAQVGRILRNELAYRGLAVFGATELSPGVRPAHQPLLE